MHSARSYPHTYHPWLTFRQGRNIPFFRSCSWMSIGSWNNPITWSSWCSRGIALSRICIRSHFCSNPVCTSRSCCRLTVTIVYRRCIRYRISGRCMTCSRELTRHMSGISCCRLLPGTRIGIFYIVFYRIIRSSCILQSTAHTKYRSESMSPYSCICFLSWVSGWSDSRCCRLYKPPVLSINYSPGFTYRR
jgi:hypothetical protein